MDREPPAYDRSESDERRGQHEASSRAEIDIERLADLVYRLAREEARLARARGARPGR